MIYAADRKILLALGELGRSTARCVVSHLGLEGNPRSQVAIMQRELDRLCVRGYAKRMDDKKPICWLRTPRGTEALNS